MKDADLARMPRLTLVLAGMVALLIIGAAAWAPQTAGANPTIAQKTGKGCPTCHTAPPALNETGKKYKETGQL